ncbi:MAG: hypothetical protein Q7R54_00010 [bacterium]|nr:hypothetical protein [bacterium]
MDTDKVGDVPESLYDVLQLKDKSGYELVVCYSLQLRHGLMGFFPAVFAEDVKRIVTTPDLLLLKKVWAMLTPRDSKVDITLFYINKQLMVGYAIVGTDEDELKRSKPEKLLSQEEFDQLYVAGGVVFRWAPGLIGNDMNADEFRQTIEAAQRQQAAA